MNLNFLENKPFVAGTGQAWMFDIDYLTDSLTYSRVSSTNLTAGSQGATPSNAGSQKDDLDSDDEPDVLIIQSTPTPLALQRQEQAGKEEADRLGLAFPSLNPMLGVGTSSISSSVSAGSTPPVSTGSTPQMSLYASPISASKPVSAGRPTSSAGKPVSAGRPTGSAGRPVSASRPTGLAGRPVSAGRPSGSANRSSVPAGHILGQSNASTSSERFHALLDFSGPDANNLESSLNVSSTITKRIHNIHPTSQVIGDINSPVHTKSQVKHKGSSESAFISYIHDQRRNNHPDFQLCMFSCFLSQEEPTTMAQVLADPDWVELCEQKCNNSKIKRGIVCRNKARLVAQGHRQEERIDYTDVFLPVARIEAIQLFLAFASFIGFKVYQMDVKSAFLYGKIAEEVYVIQPRGFEDPDYPKKVYKVVKALYGLH
uniref:Reverse transcriptase Ty1/copia-type domain-containing protein n=1 Tax=Tanacetum cinerariifolium TaxID=118510 RepID=A0A6L2L793_TANCI|nr:hypothetical protein [Tanacetum cinerariifolium]